MADSKDDVRYGKAIEKAIKDLGVLQKCGAKRLPSDPAVTILENLTAFSMLFSEQAGMMPESAEESLFQLAGIRRKEAACSRLLLSAEKLYGSEEYPKGQKFYVGEICFETKETIKLTSGRLQGVFREHNGEIKKVYPPSGMKRGGGILGENPVKGDVLWIHFNGPFLFPGTKTRFYAEVSDNCHRNAASLDQLPLFADAKWSYRGESGEIFPEIADETGVFICSGEITIFPGEAPVMTELTAEGECIKGYFLKCEFTDVDYDRVPCVNRIDGPLFEVYQTDTRMRCVHIPYKEQLLKCGSSGGWELMDVYAGNGKDGYIKWSPANPSFGFADERIAVYAREGESARCTLGILYGYDDQEFELGFEEKILPESVEIAVEKKTSEGEKFWFFRPGSTVPGAVNFICDGEKKTIRILDAGDYEGCRATLCSWAGFKENAGNISPGCRLCPEGRKKEILVNPVAGKGGAARETDRQMRQRCRNVLKAGGSIVSEQDYERAVRDIPGLCIHKVCACEDSKNWTMTVYVKVYGDRVHPLLDKRYREIITSYLSERKLLGIKVEVRDPLYMAVDVQAVVTVKISYQGCRKDITDKLVELLDYENRDGTFESIISNKKISETILKLPCVQSVDELNLRIADQAAGRQLCSIEEHQVRLPKGVLCYPGKIKLILKRSRII